MIEPKLAKDSARIPARVFVDILKQRCTDDAVTSGELAKPKRTRPGRFGRGDHPERARARGRRFVVDADERDGKWN